MRSDLGLPRSARIGTMAPSCAFVSGFASGSAFAAFNMFRLSSFDGISMTRLIEVFDIVFDPSPLSPTQADWSCHIIAIDESHVVERVPFRRERDHPNLVVLKPFVDPHKCFVPGKLLRERQRQLVPRDVLLVFLGIEIETHGLM